MKNQNGQSSEKIQITNQNMEAAVPLTSDGVKMKNRFMRRLKIAMLLSSSSALMLSFQNCAQPGASTAANNGDQTVQSSVVALSADGSGSSSPDYSADVVFRDPYTPSQLSNYNCTSVTTLTAPVDGSALEIPARAGSSSGVCYAVKLMSSTAFRPSSSNPNKDPDLITRNHDLNGYTASNTHIPYLMASSKLQLYLDGERSVLIAGGADPTAKIYVDNFLLVGLAPSTQFDNPYYYLAYGTSDSTILYNGSTTSVLFRNQPVFLERYAVGGTAPIPPISLDNKISSQVYYTLDTRAIDCGGVGYSSDMWVLFK